MTTDTPQTGSKRMKFPDIILVCSIAFAAGMVVPFAFFQLNSSASRSDTDVIGEYANAIALEKAFLPEKNLVANAPRSERNVAIYKAPTRLAPIVSDKAAVISTAVVDKTTVQQSGLTKPGGFGDTSGAAESPDRGEPRREEYASTLEPSLIADIQTELLIRGYNPGIVDGQMGGRTLSAIKALQRDHGLDETGRIDGPVIKALNITPTAKMPVFENKLKPSNSRNGAATNSDPVTTTVQQEVSTQSSGQPINLLTFGKNKNQSD